MFNMTVDLVNKELTYSTSHGSNSRC